MLSLNVPTEAEGAATPKAAAAEAPTRTPKLEAPEQDDPTPTLASSSLVGVSDQPAVNPTQASAAAQPLPQTAQAILPPDPDPAPPREPTVSAMARHRCRRPPSREPPHPLEQEREPTAPPPDGTYENTSPGVFFRHFCGVEPADSNKSSGRERERRHPAAGRDRGDALKLSLTKTR